MTGYDYIIVGSGTAGSTLAARLSEDLSARILVLEGGGPDRGFWLKLPVGYYKSIYKVCLYLFSGSPLIYILENSSKFGQKTV